jgi:hypothetical protein
MRIPNDPSDDRGGAFGELLRLQTEFQARLAEETIRYLRRLQGAGMPAAPGTVLRREDGAELAGEGAPGGTAALELEVENRQRVHCMVTPMLEPLVEASGVTWFPAVEPAPGSILVPPGEVRRVELPVQLPAELPAGTYRGALVLQGFREGAVPVAVTVREAARARRRATAGTATPRSSGRRRTASA